MRHWTSLVISKEKLAKHLKDNWFDDGIVDSLLNLQIFLKKSLLVGQIHYVYTTLHV
jgi:hypothetical protein